MTFIDIHGKISKFECGDQWYRYSWMNTLFHATWPYGRFKKRNYTAS
jgi:hypothetical protein